MPINEKKFRQNYFAKLDILRNRNLDANAALVFRVQSQLTATVAAKFNEYVAVELSHAAINSPRKFKALVKRALKTTAFPFL